MPKYDFETVYVREGSDSQKYDVPKGVLPLSIADMDFPACPEVVDALKKRLETPLFGYVEPKEGWYRSYRSWFHRRHHFDFEDEDLLFLTGVVPALSSSVRCFSRPGDRVAVFTPVYNIFFHSITNNHRETASIPIVQKEGRFHLDFEKTEEVFADPKTTLCLFCNPQNPIGIVWEKEELIALARLAKKYGVVVLSDEIHGEILPPGKSYEPFLASCPEAQEIGLMATSPTKSFNLAGIQTAGIVCLNPELRQKIARQINTDEVAEPNVFACLAAQTAFDQGEAWLEEARYVLFASRRLAEDFIAKNIPLLKTIPGEATYLLWIDASRLNAPSEELCRFLEEKAKLALNPGSEYGLGGEGYLRLNLAYPKTVLLEGLRRLQKGVELFASSHAIL